MSNPMEEILRKAPLDAKRLLADLLMEQLLSDDSIPEIFKIVPMLAKACADFEEVFQKNFLAMCTNASDEEQAQQLYPLRKEALEYVQLMKAGLESFLALHPDRPKPQ